VSEETSIDDSAGLGTEGVGDAVVETDAIRGARKTLVGIVVSDKMTKTRVVSVQRREPHKRYRKYVRRDTKHLVHDEQNVTKEGDKVLIMETRTISKRKRWRIAQILEH